MSSRLDVEADATDLFDLSSLKSAVGDQSASLAIKPPLKKKAYLILAYLMKTNLREGLEESQETGDTHGSLAPLAPLRSFHQIDFTLLLR